MIIKKFLLVSVLVLTIFAVSAPANATSYGSDISGMIYDIYGKLSISISVKDYVTLAVTLPKMEKFHEFFGFTEDGYFLDLLLMTAASSDYGVQYPTWEQNGNTFIVDLSDMAYEIESMLSQAGFDITGSATKNPVISGKVGSGANSISGKLSLGWNVSTYVEQLGGTVNGSILISMTYKGYPSTYWSWGKAKESTTSFRSAFKSALEQAISTLPVKPGKAPVK